MKKNYAYNFIHHDDIGENTMLAGAITTIICIVIAILWKMLPFFLKNIIIGIILISLVLFGIKIYNDKIEKQENDAAYLIDLCKRNPKHSAC